MKLFLLTIFHLSGVIAFAPTRSYTHSTRTNTSASTTTIKSAATSSSSPRITSESMSELDKNGYLILEDWLSKDLTQELRDDINNLRSKGKFKVARIGQDSIFASLKHVFWENRNFRMCQVMLEVNCMRYSII